MPDEIRTTLEELLHETSGAILFCRPDGSGKMTTLYTCLRELVASSRGGRSLMTLEDPIEVVVPGAAQAQINHPAGLDLASGLRSMMRQDPEVIAVGEILIPHSPEVSQMIRIQTDVNQLEETALAAGMVGLSERARQAIESGTTDPAEVRRVLGLSHRARLQ